MIATTGLNHRVIRRSWSRLPGCTCGGSSIVVTSDSPPQVPADATENAARCLARLYAKGPDPASRSPPPILARRECPFSPRGVSPFQGGRVNRMASTHRERFGNLAMLFFVSRQAPVLKFMEAVRMVTDLPVAG